MFFRPTSNVGSAFLPLLVLQRQKTTISVILLQRLRYLGEVGRVVTVKRGYARNFLIPKQFAAYATGDNKTKHAEIISRAEKHYANLQNR
mmetsp:Transcript_33810/g.24849  ORF Transcript_33810/g.24849 Transcript_33810/m.24849 type:complete len:90 (-) Transcript_33810:63-332(-)